MKKTYFKTLGIILVVLFLYSCGTTSTGYSYRGYDQSNRVQKGVEIRVGDEDISYNLDLRAVVDVFANSRNLEDFERRINGYDRRVNNLDLNNDGQVDYLRVVELNEGYTHVVILQAVLGRNIYQDVASILLGRSQKSTVYLQVIGDPYIYGSNYIIEPIFGYMPPIFSFFWRNNYTAWNSPYYWGYYPNNYKTYRPYSINDYNKNIGVYIDNSRMNYNYGSQIRNQNYDKMRKTLSRRDYEISNPNRSFSARNQNRSVVNKRDFERRSSASTIRKDVDDKDNTRRQSSRVTNTRQQPKNRDYAPTVVRGRRDSNVVRVQKGEQIDRRGSRDVVVNRNSDEVTRKSVKRNKTSVRSTRKNRNRIYSDSPRRSRSSSRTR